MDIYKQIEALKIVPVVKLGTAEDAVPLAEALIDGGLPVAEITFRTAAAEESIRTISGAFQQMLVGAGTVVDISHAERAVKAGAKFIVSPGFSPAVTKFAVEKGIPIFPGVCTPTEIIAALEFGLKVVKFFPAKQYGGLAAIKALAAPFPEIRFMPTGGVSSENLLEYLSCDKVIACGGSWMVKESLIGAHNFGEITRLTNEAVALASRE
ncbi:MAG: bifunctional 4-hydroxy-2-oxoglutarate aldolase/2-dehydro-3-deoxy-phosphogluconate aldolase [Synergistaceae bacterium]|nr:bifunctional 4-hydroxy-2-oxoglutarate aldolase/2-dehydro-3-deoxy-phosphogluconate aldolase [Synergistaceae bacterium]